MGTSNYLKSQSKDVVTVGVARLPNNPVPGVRTPNLLKQIAFDWQASVDHVREIGTKESFESSLRLCREGIMAGPSSGFALAGLIDFLKEQKKDGNLERLKNRNGEIVAVFICPDSPLPYLDEYFEYLDESQFPKIENEGLLIHDPKRKNGSVVSTQAMHEITAENAYALLYSVPKEDLWKLIQEDGEIPLTGKALIVDVRTDQEFRHFHLPGSIHIELQTLAEHLPKLKKEAADKTVMFVCKSGNRSGIATELAKAKNLDALNLIGGVTEWSRLNLPRIRPGICI